MDTNAIYPMAKQNWHYPIVTGFNGNERIVWNYLNVGSNNHIMPFILCISFDGENIIKIEEFVVK